ncbi:prolipoprotein diacylglyceryl transferase family protein [Calothrix sp. 336/3]|uniref:prolipoprotein diacylglyceryl transferase family protein n=1 Tax=Calothrix sp. 336/3 TaxID=1337936 RepID=UPI0004E428DC|nr:prolipoprotein diacylglyceryl transferase family protein [Calothrix sp. 336/3]AKG20706.1 hypothetical protein IJ00_04745 [Calothrix sp. 336/3]
MYNSLISSNIKLSEWVENVQHPDLDKEPQTLNFLERIIYLSHRITLFGKKYSPYSLMFNVGLLSVLGTVWFLSVKFHLDINIFAGINYILIFHYPGYPLYLWVKSRLFNIQGRSYIQDCIFFLIPGYTFCCWLMGQSVLVSLDLLGILLPLIAGIVRVGCFLSGCCHGKFSAKFGVLYTPSYLLPEHRDTKLAAAFYTGYPVFPIQLVEASFNLTLFVILLVRLLLTEEFTGQTLSLYFLVYCIYRFFADFYRESSIRPKIGKFSEAQCISMVLILVCTLTLQGEQILELLKF